MAWEQPGAAVSLRHASQPFPAYWTCLAHRQNRCLSLSREQPLDQTIHTTTQPGLGREGRQLFQLTGNRPRLQWRQVAHHRQIDIRLRRMGALGTGSEENRCDNLRMPAKRVAEKAMTPVVKRSFGSCFGRVLGPLA